jgi:hypothetical protein
VQAEMARYVDASGRDLCEDNPKHIPNRDQIALFRIFLTTNVHGNDKNKITKTKYIKTK